MKNLDIIKQDYKISKADREKLLKQKLRMPVYHSFLLYSRRIFRFCTTKPRLLLKNKRIYLQLDLIKKKIEKRKNVIFLLKEGN